MGELATKLQVKKNVPAAAKSESEMSGTPAQGPIQGLRRQVEQMLEDFEQGVWPSTFGKGGNTPQGGTLTYCKAETQRDNLRREQRPC